MKLYFVLDGSQKTGSCGERVHTGKMAAALRDAGAEIVTDIDGEYDFAVSITPPLQFEPVAGRRNIVFTMTETDGLIEKVHGSRLAEAELVIVPTEFSTRVFSRYFPGPFEVCPEGVNPREMPYVSRSEPDPDEPFRFLSVSAANGRKGLTYLWQAWRLWHNTGRMPQNVEWVLKIAPDPAFPEPGYIERVDSTRITIDSRDLDRAAIFGLYRDAHAFVCPTEGEGWGLPLLEAESTGLPSIYTKFSALADWPDHSAGYPLTRFAMVPDSVHRDDLDMDVSDFGREGIRSVPSMYPPGYGGYSDAFSAQADPLEIMLNMMAIYRNYPEALERGRRASEYVRGNLTWEKAAVRFLDICKKYA